MKKFSVEPTSHALYDCCRFLQKNIPGSTVHLQGKSVARLQIELDKMLKQLLQ